VPFAGASDDGQRVIDRLSLLERREGDELVVVDNSGEGLRADGAPVRVVALPAPRSSYSARNAGARASAAEWLVFLDADTFPRRDLLDRYFEPLPDARTAVLAGGVLDWAARGTLCARYVAARAQMAQQTTLANAFAPYAQTANCAVRRSAFERVGGFSDAIRSGGDADLCWRLAQAGWELDQRPAAAVEHRNRERVGDLLAQIARHGAGLAWLERRHPGAAPAPGPIEALRRSAHYVREAAGAKDGESAAFALLDLLTLAARDAGRLASNRVQ
jgi:glycosyltransferase involved in cell wall biosynthesis